MFAFSSFQVNTTQLLMNHVEMYVDLVRVEERRGIMRETEGEEVVNREKTFFFPSF